MRKAARKEHKLWSQDLNTTLPHLIAICPGEAVTTLKSSFLIWNKSVSPTL